MTAKLNRFWKYGSIFAVVVFAGVDVFALATEGVDATFSRYVLAVAHDHPMIPLATGIVLGHLFWPQPKLDQARLDQAT